MGRWVQEQARKEVVEFYPKDSDDATPIVYFWAKNDPV